MNKSIKCHLCGLTDGHTRQCTMNIKIDVKSHRLREDKKKILDIKILKLNNKKVEK